MCACIRRHHQPIYFKYPPHPHQNRHPHPHQVNWKEPTRSRLQGPTRIATQGAALLPFPTGAAEGAYVPVQGSVTELDSLYSALQWRLTVAWVKGQPLLAGSTQTAQADSPTSPLAVYWFVVKGAKPAGKDATVTWSMGQDGLIKYVASYGLLPACG